MEAAETPIAYDPLDVGDIDFDTYQLLLDREPVYRTKPGFCVISCYDDVREVIKRHHAEGSHGHSTDGDATAEVCRQMDELSEGLPLTMGELLAGRIITAADPPKHIQLRGAINRAFLPGQMAQWTGFVENEVAELTADLDGTEPFDLMQRLAVPLPVADLDMIKEAVCLRGLWQ